MKLVAAAAILILLPAAHALTHGRVDLPLPPATFSLGLAALGVAIALGRIGRRDR